jgi:hypothetical protein
LNNRFKHTTLLYLQGFQNLVDVFIKHHHKKPNLQGSQNLIGVFMRNYQEFNLEGSLNLVGINLILSVNNFDLQGCKNLAGQISFKYQII